MPNNIDAQSDTQEKPDSLTPITNPQAQNIIAHINEEHREDLADLMHVFHHIDSDILQDTQVELVKVYTQGFDIQLLPIDTPTSTQAALKSNPEKDIYFIAFESPIKNIEDLSFQYILLKQKADKKIGKKTIKLTDKLFELKDSYYVTKNMFRLVLSSFSDQSIPENEAGYAYLFDLATFNNEGEPLTEKRTENLSLEASNNPNNALNSTSNNSNNSNNNPKPQTASSKQDKIRQHCYYTLRKAWQDKTDAHQPLAWVDIYIHGDTPGGRWALSLKPGDIIKTKREIPEKLAHLNVLGNNLDIIETTGIEPTEVIKDNAQTRHLLVADETSIPTVARLLELWQQPTAPLIICATQDLEDQHYLDLNQVELSDALTEGPIILPIKTHSDELDTLAERIDTCVGEYLAQNPIHINRVWGALEASVTKQLRRLLQQRLALTRSEMVIKVYWRR